MNSYISLCKIDSLWSRYHLRLTFSQRLYVEPARLKKIKQQISCKIRMTIGTELTGCCRRSCNKHQHEITAFPIKLRDARNLTVGILSRWPSFLKSPLEKDISQGVNTIAENDVEPRIIYASWANLIDKLSTWPILMPSVRTMYAEMSNADKVKLQATAFCIRFRGVCSKTNQQQMASTAESDKR